MGVRLEVSILYCGTIPYLILRYTPSKRHLVLPATLFVCLFVTKPWGTLSKPATCSTKPLLRTRYRFPSFCLGFKSRLDEIKNAHICGKQKPERNCIQLKIQCHHGLRSNILILCSNIKHVFDY
eukprot:sb/3475764/